MSGTTVAAAERLASFRVASASTAAVEDEAAGVTEDFQAGQKGLGGGQGQ